MVSVFVSLMMFLTPMGNGNGHHYGWGKKTRSTPAYQPVTPVAPGHGTSPPAAPAKDSDGPGAHQYSND